MEWKRGPTIGRGASAAVYLATTSSGEIFAVKSIELERSALLRREHEILSRINSDRVVKCLGFDVTFEENQKQPTYNLFMEYVPGGTLSDVIQRRGSSPGESAIRFYTHQILQGLDYLHSNGLVHCDIKGQNILIGKDGAKIADLGCARLASRSEISGGTPAFMAPEVARGEEQGFPADVWALGCTVIEMATGNKNPWPEIYDDPLSALYRIGYSGEVPKSPGWLSEEGEDFLSKCLDRDANSRWTVKQLLRHPFFDDLELDSEQETEITRSSPTGVLDQVFWDSLNLSESSKNPTDFDVGYHSPAERIKNLIGGDFSSGSNFPNRTEEEEEDWITIRSNHDTEPITSFEDLASVENLVRSIEDDHLVLHSSYEETSRTDSPRLSHDSRSICQSIQFVSVPRFLKSERKSIKTYRSVQHFLESKNHLQSLSLS